MALPEWHIAVKLADQPLAPKSILRLPETELGECPLGGCSISCLKQLITGRLQESVPDPELIGRCRGAAPSCCLRRASGMGSPGAGGAGPGWFGGTGQVAWCSEGLPEALLRGGCLSALRWCRRVRPLRGSQRSCGVGALLKEPFGRACRYRRVRRGELSSSKGGSKDTSVNISSDFLSFFMS